MIKTFSSYTNTILTARPQTPILQARSKTNAHSSTHSKVTPARRTRIGANSSSQSTRTLKRVSRVFLPSQGDTAAKTIKKLLFLPLVISEKICNLLPNHIFTIIVGKTYTLMFKRTWKAPVRDSVGTGMWKFKNCCKK
jgi:hypothetical protein